MEFQTSVVPINDPIACQVYPKTGAQPEFERTLRYMTALAIGLEIYLSNDVITHAIYSEIIMSLPSDLACKLRLVPDHHLSSKLSHLFTMVDIIKRHGKVAGTKNYKLLSIEGSNKFIPFDCDMVIADYNTSSIVFIDFTAATNIEKVMNKYKVINNNIEISRFSNARSSVETIRKIDKTIDIKFPFISNEPGTQCLKVLDSISTMSNEQRAKINDKFISIYQKVSDKIIEESDTKAPGDYKEYDVPITLVDSAINLVGTQEDVDSLDFLSRADLSDPVRYPYMIGLMELSRKAQNFKHLIPVEGSEVFESRDVVNCLASLSDNWLCKALHAACLTENIVCISDADEISFLSEFPCPNNSDTIPESLKYKACIKRKEGHIFQIKFNTSYTDEKLKRILSHVPVIKDKKRVPAESRVTKVHATEMVIDAIKDYRSQMSSFMSPAVDKPKDTIWKKIQTISALASNDLENFGRSTCSLLDSFLSLMSSMYIGSSLSHWYEINRSILASLKASPGNSYYYVGINGSYDSVSIIKMSSTLDSLSKTNYCVIHRRDRNPKIRRTRLDGSTKNGIFMSKFYSTDPNILSYNLKIPYTISSLATWELENNVVNGAIATGKALQIIFDSSLHSLVNRDQFAQSSEQIRYFYMSAIGYGGSAPDIVEKTTFMTIRHSWEVLYMMRSFKLAACLNMISATKRLSEIENKETRELSVCFPHSNFPSRTFSQTISSMYLCRAFNKFRAFHEMSDAICYNEILEEMDIYKSRISEDVNAVSGLSTKLLEASYLGQSAISDYLLSDHMVDNEVEFSLMLATSRSKRYSGSIGFIIGATLHNTETSPGVIDSIYTNLNKSPIEACTMRGSMDAGAPSEKGQGIRAASAVLEEMIRQQGHNPSLVNKSVLGAANLFDTMKNNDSSFSIFSCVMKQFCLGSEPYRYRVVDKDQTGHREISVLNFAFRVGALFVETVSRGLSNVVADIEVVHNPNKDKIVEDAIKDSFKRTKVSSGVFCYDNSDQKRWGPNHNMNFFACMIYSMLKDEIGLSRMIYKVFDSVFDKRAKFPEPLINLIMVKKVRDSRSEPIKKFIDRCAPMMDNKIFEVLVAQGMCQGIFHDTSSVFHAIKAKASTHISESISRGCNIRNFTTSDDALKIIYIPSKTDRIKLVKMIHVVDLRVGNLMNIIRSNPKSAFNFYIAELNSIFYKMGTMATPSIKQRIAKLDVGNGLNIIEDYLTALSSAANYLTSGGSYMGTYICSILNLTLHTEQWLRWDLAKPEHYYKPVELGGFPFIEPITTVVSGGISNMYLRSKSLATPESYSRLVVSTLLCPPERIMMSEFVRSKASMTLSNGVDADLSIVKGAGPFGLFQTIKTDRKLSVFEKRHGISRWIIPDEFSNIVRNSPDSKDFLFTIFRNTSINTLDTTLGVNSFFVRLAEPWVSYKRNCFRISKNSPFASTFGGEGAYISHMMMHDKFKSMSITDAGFELKMATRRINRKPEFEIMETQLTVRFTDSFSLVEFLSGQEAETFKMSNISPSIQNITLRGHTASDSESYFLAILKATSGQKVSSLINKFRRSPDAYDSIKVMTPTSGNDLTMIESIVTADNAVSLYNKFIRRETKMIVPNNVTDLRELCVDIIRNKFTESMGVVTSGSPKLSEERIKTFTYTSWYRDLVAYSEKMESQVSKTVLGRTVNDIVKVGIESERGIITSRDMFKVTSANLPNKTVLLDANNRDTFINTLRTWLAANANFVFSRNTLDRFITNKLTFKHDYYTGSGTYKRYAGSKYALVTSKSCKAMHLIESTVETSRGRTTTHYNHVFIFSENVDGNSLQCTISQAHAEEKWLVNLKATLDKIKRIDTRVIYKSGLDPEWSKTEVAHRKTMMEVDTVRFVSITPGTTFELEVRTDTLVFSLKSKNITLPISYLQPSGIDSITHGYTLTHHDVTVATRDYSTLRKISSGFSRQVISKDKSMEKLINFIIVGSTIKTPDFIIRNEMQRLGLKTETAEQLDIIRTMLVKNPDIGINYSSSRFTQSLLNLGMRRNHKFSFFTKEIMGSRVENESEFSSGEEDEDEIIAQGTIEEAIVTDIDTPEYSKTIIPMYLSGNSGSTVPNITSALPVVDLSEPLIDDDEDWADEVVIDQQRIIESLAPEVLTREEYNFDTDSDTDIMDYYALPDDKEDPNDEIHTADLGNTTFAGMSSVDAEVKMESSHKISDFLGNVFSGLDLGDDFSVNFDDDYSENGADLAMKEMALDNLDDLFQRAINNQYGKITDQKDVALKSEVTSHSINPNLENARSMIAYLKDWLNTAGSLKETDFDRSGEKNVTDILATYLMFDRANMLSIVNPIAILTGHDTIDLPVELSALAVVSQMFS